MEARGVNLQVPWFHARGVPSERDEGGAIQLVDVRRKGQQFAARPVRPAAFRIVFVHGIGTGPEEHACPAHLAPAQKPGTVVSRTPSHVPVAVGQRIEIAVVVATPAVLPFIQFGFKGKIRNGKDDQPQGG